MSRPKRAERRAADRLQAKLGKDLLRLAANEPGGSPQKPIAVTSPSEVEPHAASLPCPVCQSGVRVEEHTAEVIGGVRLRVARVVCTFCKTKRAVYFQLAGSMPN